MSRIGKQPIKIPTQVSLKISGSRVNVKGPKGELAFILGDSIAIKQHEGQLLVTRKGNAKRDRSMHGLTRALLYNAVVGTTEGYSKQLEMVGVGYRAKIEGNNLVLTVGYSHPVVIKPPENIELSVEGNTLINVSGIDKQQVGEIAAQIRNVRPPEPYKGKGIRYKDEVVHKKPGKAAKAIGIGE